MNKKYVPQPIDVNDFQFPAGLDELVELLAKNVHEIWAKNRIEQGWVYGDTRNDALKYHPCLVPYEDLPEKEKEYDRATAMGSLKLIMKLGYRISKDNFKETL